MNIIEQIENTDVLIWDEISMSSERLFHIVSLLQQEKSIENAFPFGGIQVILCGDFWQLKPIPSIMDGGDPVYESKLFQQAFPHRFQLAEVLRQDEGQERLKQALDMRRFGRCDEKTEQYFCSLSRDMPSSVGNLSPTHIYFKRLPVEVHNASVLTSQVQN